jgi:hypothetical protein
MSKTTLDEKLHKILMNVANDYANSVNPELDGTLYRGPDVPTAIAVIHAAFKEEGFAKVTKHPYRDELRRPYTQYTITYEDGSGELARVPLFGIQVGVDQ